MSLPLTYKKADLLAKLEACRKTCERIDAQAKAAHRKDELVHLAQFRVNIRAALKWDYKRAARESFYVDARRGPNDQRRGPTCPESQVGRLDYCIFMITKSGQTRFTIQDGGKYRAVYALLTLAAPKAKGLCQ